MARATNLVAGVSFGGWIYLTFFALYLVFTTRDISDKKICYFQRNLLYVNSFVLTIVTPTFLWSNLFGYFNKTDKTIFTFTGNDMPALNYFLLILTIQIFSCHQVVNLTRILYELFGKKTSQKWFTLIAFYKMLFYFLLTQCVDAILFDTIVLILIDYTEHIVATIIYCRMLCCVDYSKINNNSSDHIRSRDASDANNVVDSTQDAVESGSNGKTGLDESYMDPMTNPLEKAIIKRDSSGNVTKIRARWGLGAVLAHMLSIVPLLIVASSNSKNAEHLLRYTLIIGYVVIALSIWCYKWLIINTPAGWMPPPDCGCCGKKK